MPGISAVPRPSGRHRGTARARPRGPPGRRSRVGREDRSPRQPEPRPTGRADGLTGVPGGPQGSTVYANPAESTRM